MQKSIQLKLNLWEELEAASQQPEDADLGQLWLGLEQILGSVPRQQQLAIAAEAITQIIEVFYLRADGVLSALELKDNSQGPVLSEDFLAGWMRQSMTVDLSDLKEEGFALEPVTRQRKGGLDESGGSVAGAVDKAALLEAFDSEIEVVEAKAQAESEAVSVAHSEDAIAWAKAIAQWLAAQPSRGPISLMALQQGLGMSLVEVWLGLLLGQGVKLEQRGEFYDFRAIRVQAVNFE